jgi:hypothetical protein
VKGTNLPLPRKVHKALLDRGWTVSLSGKGHYRYAPPPDAPPTARPVYVSNTPSDNYRSQKNALASFRRQGVDILQAKPVK